MISIKKLVKIFFLFQTNYFLSFLIIFTVTTFINPGEIILSILTMSSSTRTISFFFFPVFIISVYGTLYLASALLSRVKNIKGSHPMLVMISTFFIGYFIIYEVNQ